MTVEKDGGTPAAQVARYEYTVWWGQFELGRIRDGADALVMEIEYTTHENGAGLADRVLAIRTPDVDGRNGNEVTTFEYTLRDDLDDRLLSTKVHTAAGTEEQRTAIHRYDDMGHMTEVVRPDNLVMRFEYDSAGRMSRAEYPSGRVQRWIYGDGSVGSPRRASDQVRRDPVALRWLAGLEQWTCYEVDPVTNEVWRTLAPSGVTRGETDDCLIRRAGSVLKPEATETIFGWMKAAH